MKNSDHFRRIYRIYPKSLKKNRKMSTCNRLDSKTPGYRLVMPKNLPEHWGEVGKLISLVRVKKEGGDMIGENRQFVTDEPVELEK